MDCKGIAMQHYATTNLHWSDGKHAAKLPPNFWRETMVIQRFAQVIKGFSQRKDLGQARKVAEKVQNSRFSGHLYDSSASWNKPILKQHFCFLNRYFLIGPGSKYALKPRDFGVAMLARKHPKALRTRLTTPAFRG